MATTNGWMVTLSIPDEDGRTDQLQFFSTVETLEEVGDEIRRRTSAEFREVGKYVQRIERVTVAPVA